MFRESDKFLVIFFLGCLLLVSLLDSRPIFEPIQRSRLFAFTLLGIVGWCSVVTVVEKHPISFRFLNDWWPVIGICFAYESLKHLHANKITLLLGIQPLDELMLHIDRTLFGEALPLYFQMFAVPWFEKLLIMFYFWGYYLFPVLALGYAYYQKKDYTIFLAIRRGLIISCIGAYVMYILIPVAGPLFIIASEFSAPSLSQKIFVNRYHDLLRYNWDCFPSMHTALPWLLTMLSWPLLSKFLRMAAIISSVLIMLATLVLRFHYGIDLIAGVLWALIVYFQTRPKIS